MTKVTPRQFFEYRCIISVTRGTLSSSLHINWRREKRPLWHSRYFFGALRFVCTTDKFPRKRVCRQTALANIRNFLWLRCFAACTWTEPTKFKSLSFYENWNLCSLMLLPHGCFFYSGEGRSFHCHKSTSSLWPDMSLFDNLISSLATCERIGLKFTN